MKNHLFTASRWRDVEGGGGPLLTWNWLLTFWVNCLLSTLSIYTMTPKRVALKSVKSLTFHQGQETVGRRTDPIRMSSTQPVSSEIDRIAQLQCHGKACRRFQPTVVQCQNTGDDGSGSVQWKVSPAIFQ
jgi:hypothetical protein